MVFCLAKRHNDLAMYCRSYKMSKTQWNSGHNNRTRDEDSFLISEDKIIAGKIVAGHGRWR